MRRLTPGYSSATWLIINLAQDVTVLEGMKAIKTLFSEDSKSRINFLVKNQGELELVKKKLFVIF